MIVGIKKCIDNGDIIGLRYIFLDSLDVDPTFERYKDDYAICRNLEGMFEPYIELTPLSSLSLEWNMDYWGKIKFDQKKNFSKKRFEHMIEIAKVVHAEKIERLLTERAVKQAKIEQIEQLISKPTTQVVSQSKVERPIQANPISVKPIPIQKVITEIGISDSDQAKINKNKRDIELNNQRVEQEELEKKRQREERTREIERQNSLLEEQSQSKKAWGIVAVIAIIVIIVVVVLVLKVL